jgi:hypothetical protein
LKGSIGSATRFEALYPKAQSYWLPEVGERVQMKDSRFPAKYGALGVCTRRYGLGRVRVLLDDGRSFSSEICRLHCIERWGLMASVIAPA